MLTGDAHGEIWLDCHKKSSCDSSTPVIMRRQVVVGAERIISIVHIIYVLNFERRTWIRAPYACMYAISPIVGSLGVC